MQRIPLPNILTISQRIPRTVVVVHLLSLFLTATCLVFESAALATGRDNPLSFLTVLGVISAIVLVGTMLAVHSPIIQQETDQNIEPR